MADDISIAKGGLFRVFVQHEGPSPENAYHYVGCLNLGGFQEDLGTGEPIYCPSSAVMGQYDIVDITAPPQALPTTDFTQRMDLALRDFWWELRRRKCEFNMFIKSGRCVRPDDPHDFLAGVLVKRAKATAFNTGPMNSLDENAASDLSGSLQMRDFDRFLSMYFGEVADSTVLDEALDGLFADSIQCGDCGSPSDGCQKMYVLTDVVLGSPSLSPQVAYSINGGGIWATDVVDSLSGQAPRRMAQVGTRLVVISQVDLAHHHKLQSGVDDGGSTGGWTRVAGGYVASAGPRAVWSKSPSETFIVAAGGYIYFMSNPTAAVTVLSDGSVTTQDLNDVRGIGSTIVGVGNSNAVVVSRNNGRTWSLVTGPAVGVTLSSVEVVSERVWWVTTATGDVYYTTNGGQSWVAATPDDAITAINRIRFVDEIVGYMAVEVSGVARIYRTKDSGYSWHYQEPYVNSLPTSARLNFVAPCPGNYNVALAGGLAATGTDGLVALGAADLGIGS